MADYDSSLPVRTENNGDVVAQLVDGTVTTQKLKIEADGSINVNDNGGSITVDATDLDIRDLSASQDNVAISDGSDTLAVNADGSINITDNSGSITVDAVDLDIRDLTQTDEITVFQGTDPWLIADGGNSITVDAVDLDIRDLSASSDSVAAHLFDESGVAFSAANPLPVSVQDGSGTEVNNYNTAASVAAAATSNHDYTVPAGNDFLLKRVLAAASGKMKIEIQVDTGAGFNTIAVGFNSTATPNIIGMDFAPVQLVPTDDIRIIRTNLDKQPQDLYSTIVGLILD